eukprot:GHVO01035620.1.p1 GENE.GHVO01035620.1~~GHVO01035620.1.p1  ORF type:complete len:215 (+),score=9.35 GHVO01035620.1:81-725(+)
MLELADTARCSRQMEEAWNFPKEYILRFSDFENHVWDVPSCNMGNKLVNPLDGHITALAIRSPVETLVPYMSTLDLVSQARGGSRKTRYNVDNIKLQLPELKKQRIIQRLDSMAIPFSTAFGRVTECAQIEYPCTLLNSATPQDLRSLMLRYGCEQWGLDGSCEDFVADAVGDSCGTCCGAWGVDGLPCEVLNGEYDDEAWRVLPDNGPVTKST